MGQLRPGNRLSRYILLPFSLLLVLAADLPPGHLWGAPPLPEANQAPISPALSFGSHLILEGCWSEAERRGIPAEKKVVFRRAAPAKAPAPSTAPGLVLPPLPPERWGSIRAVTPEAGRKLLALTFDLCEGQGEISGYDGEVVDFLRGAGLKATFFAGGKWLRSHPQRAMQLMADPLFEIGNHSWSHPNFRRLAAAAQREQLVRTQAQYALLRAELAAKASARGLPEGEMDKIPRLPTLFRFPYGACDAPALEVTADCGLAAIQWSLVTADAVRTQTPAKIAHIILAQARPGAIVIMHGNGRGLHTAQALTLCVPPLLDQGYEFVTVSELLQAGPVVASPSCYEEKPGDNRRYDRLSDR